MKNKYALLLMISLFLGGLLKAQNANDWQSMGLNIHDGTNRVSGVDGYCKLTTCNGVETVLIKLVNLNPYTIKAGWKDLILTKDDQRLSGHELQDSVIIAPGAQVVGDCSGNNPRLAIKLGDFGTDGANFANVLASDFDFAIVHSLH